MSERRGSLILGLHRSPLCLESKAFSPSLPASSCSQLGELVLEGPSFCSTPQSIWSETQDEPKLASDSLLDTRLLKTTPGCRRPAWFQFGGNRREKNDSLNTEYCSDQDKDTQPEQILTVTQRKRLWGIQPFFSKYCYDLCLSVISPSHQHTWGGLCDYLSHTVGRRQQITSGLVKRWADVTFFTSCRDPYTDFKKLFLVLAHLLFTKLCDPLQHLKPSVWFRTSQKQFGSISWSSIHLYSCDVERISFRNI